MMVFWVLVCHSSSKRPTHTQVASSFLCEGETITGGKTARTRWRENTCGEAPSPIAFLSLLNNVDPKYRSLPSRVKILVHRGCVYFSRCIIILSLTQKRETDESRLTTGAIVLPIGECQIINLGSWRHLKLFRI